MEGVGQTRRGVRVFRQDIRIERREGDVVKRQGVGEIGPEKRVGRKIKFGVGRGS